MSLYDMGLHMWPSWLPCPPLQQSLSSSFPSVLTTSDSCRLLKEQLFNSDAEDFLKTYLGLNLDAKTGVVVDCLRLTLRSVIPSLLLKYAVNRKDVNEVLTRD